MAEHGIECYRKGCHCDVGREAARVERAAYRERTRTQTAPAPDLDAIRYRLEHATAGPWEVCPHPDHADEDTLRSPAGYLIHPRFASLNHSADGTFIAHARDDIALLLAEIDRLREEVDRG